MGLVPMTLFLATAIVVRNLAVADAFCERQTDNVRRRAMGLAPRTRRRRRTTLSQLAITSANAPPWSVRVANSATALARSPVRRARATALLRAACLAGANSWPRRSAT